jgi:hypothetical protein
MVLVQLREVAGPAEPMVDDRGRQPQHALLHAVEDREVYVSGGRRNRDTGMLRRSHELASASEPHTDHQ